MNDQYVRPDEKQNLYGILTNKELRRRLMKIRYKNYHSLSKKDWHSIFNDINHKIEVSIDDHDNEAADYWKEVYDDFADEMHVFHPDWKTNLQMEQEDIDKYVGSINKCGHGYEWVDGYHKSNGTYVKGFCRKKHDR